MRTIVLKAEGITRFKLPSSKQTDRANYSVLTSYQKELEHNGFGLKYVVSGKETFWLDGFKVDVEENQCLLVNNGCPIRYDLKSSKKATEGICVYVDEFDLRGLVNGIIQTDIDDSSCSSFQEIPQIVLNNRQLSYLLQKHFGNDIQGLDHEIDWQCFKEQLAEIIVLYTFKRYDFLSLNKLKRPAREELLRRIARAIEWMYYGQRKSLCIDDLASTLGFSTYHFIRQFKVATGVSPYSFWKDIQMSKAKKLLVTNEFTIAEIAEEFGYSDISAFSKAFKNRFQMSPTNYKKESNFEQQI